MLHIILLILKIIGIILLCLFLLLLALALAVLFVPVRYSAQGKKGAPLRDIHVKGSVSWLLHLVHLGVVYADGEPDLKLRVFGIPIWKSKDGGDLEDRPDHPAKNKPKEEPVSGVSSEAQFQKSDEPGPQEEPDESRLPEEPEPNGSSPQEEPDEPGLQEEKDKPRLPEEPKTDAYTIGDEDTDSDRDEETGLFGRIAGWFGRLYRGFCRFVEGIKSFWRRLRDVKTEFDRYWQWLTKDATKLAFTFCRGEVIRFLRDLAPKKYDVFLRFGTGDPASTGQLLGAVAVLYPFTKGRLRITPEFQDKILEGQFRLSGRMRVCKAVAAGFRIFRNKNVRAAYKAWQEK